MNRNKKGVMPEITRETYKNVKKYDRQQFTAFCTNLYGYGYEDGRESVPGIDVAEIMEAVSKVKGIGSKKMDDIKAAIESMLSGGVSEMTNHEAAEIINDYSNFAEDLESYTDINDARKMAIDALREIEEYQAIGTIEECREAREKQKAKKPRIHKVDEDAVYMKCPNCKLTTVLYNGMEPDYCPKCGQALLFEIEIGE